MDFSNKIINFIYFLLRDVATYFLNIDLIFSQTIYCKFGNVYSFFLFRIRSSWFEVVAQCALHMLFILAFFKIVSRISSQYVCSNWFFSNWIFLTCWMIAGVIGFYNLLNDSRSNWIFLTCWMIAGIIEFFKLAYWL